MQYQSCIIRCHRSFTSVSYETVTSLSVLDRGIIQLPDFDINNKYDYGLRQFGISDISYGCNVSQLYDWGICQLLDRGTGQL